MDYRCAAHLSGRNTIIYGHNMKSGKMFGGLKSCSSRNTSTSTTYFTL
ncbi:MAG: sortase [Clostridia bacterium]|nr:sortase [Clostridia bacterium]